MTKEQFFKAIDGVDDKLLEGVFEDAVEELSGAETQHGAVYRPEYRSHRKPLIAVACLAAVVGAGFAVKAGVDSLSARNASHIETPADASGDTIESPENNSADTSGTSFPWHDYMSEDGLPGDKWSLTTGCLVYISFSDDEKTVSPAVLEITKPQLVTANLTIDFDPDPKMPTDNIPYRIFAFADGKPIEFAPEGTDDYALQHDYFMDENDIKSDKAGGVKYNDGTIVYTSRFEDTIKIDFKADESIHRITFVCSFFPDYSQPQSWLGFQGTYSAAAINTAFVSDSLPETKQLGEYLPIADEHDPEIGFFNLYLSKHNSDRPYILNDLEYSALNDTICIEFKNAKPDESGLFERDNLYYLLLLIDGKPQPIFDGDYTYPVDCKRGERIFKYKIPPELLPTSGKHTIQGVAFPAEDCNWHDNYSTPRIRTVALTE